MWVEAVDEGLERVGERVQSRLREPIDDEAPDELDVRRDGADSASRAQAVRAARLGALADDAGKALDQALVEHGAPARPVKAQPVRWVKKRPQAAA